MTQQHAISQPKLSIMVPAYGESPYLEETLKSLIENSTTEISQIFVFDDASTTSHILDTCNKFGQDIQYNRNKTNIGLAGNFQNCINQSTTKYTMIIGSDDRVMPGFEETFLRAVGEWPETSILQLGVRAIDENGNVINGLTERIKAIISPVRKMDKNTSGAHLIKRLLIGQWLYFPAIVWRTETLKRYPLNLEYRTAVDLNLILEMALKNEIFTLCSRPVFEYRRHKESVSSQLGRSAARTKEELLVHEDFLEKAHDEGLSKFDFLARLALTIRLHAVKSGILLLIKDPRTAMELIRISMKPVRIRS